VSERGAGSSGIEATAGAKMVYLIRRRETASREELVAHWFANHMPGVIEGQLSQAAEGRRAAWRYMATVFDASDGGDERTWDGMADEDAQQVRLTDRDAFLECVDAVRALTAEFLDGLTARRSRS
jgi:hypothetical protein